MNTAGVLWFDKDKSIVDMTIADWDRIMAINLRSFVLTARAAVPGMKKAGGGVTAQP